jgi:hypothetical protein
MTFIDGKIRRLAINRSRGSSDQFLNLVLDAGLEDVESAVDEHFDSFARSFRAARYAQGSLVEDVVNSGSEVIDERGIANVTFDYLDAATSHRGLDVAPGATDKIVDDTDFSCSCIQELVDDRAADKSSTACD